MEKNNFYFALPLYLTMALNWMFYFKYMKYFADLDLTKLNYLHFLPLLVVTFNSNAGQFLVSHELFHKPELYNRILGNLHTLKNLYMHYGY